MYPSRLAKLAIPDSWWGNASIASRMKNRSSRCLLNSHCDCEGIGASRSCSTYPWVDLKIVLAIRRAVWRDMERFLIYKGDLDEWFGHSIGAMYFHNASWEGLEFPELPFCRGEFVHCLFVQEEWVVACEECPKGHSFWFHEKTRWDALRTFP